MSDLIERLERATGPNRRLDRLIGEAVGARMLDSGDVIGLGYEPYTASLDAALTLVPEGYHADSKSAPHRKGFTALVWHDTEQNGHADGPTRALALCIAALKAREAAK